MWQENFSGRTAEAQSTALALKASAGEKALDEARNMVRVYQMFKDHNKTWLWGLVVKYLMQMDTAPIPHEKQILTLSIQRKRLNGNTLF